MALGSPLLDQYNQDGQITPGLQAALDKARQTLAPAPLATGVAAPPPNAGTPAPSAPPAAAPALSQPKPQAQPSQDQQEFTRLTTGDTGKSGIEQIHNPWLRTPLRVLDAVGSAFLPGLTMGLPGTQLHHQLLVSQAARNVQRGQAAEKNSADVAHTGAETKELGSRANEEQARADSLKNPKPDKIATPFEAWQKQHPDDPAENWLAIQEGVKEKQPNEYADFKTGYMKAHPDATMDQIVSEYAKAHQAPQKTPINEYEDFKADYLKTNPHASVAEIQKAFKKNTEKPEDHGQDFVDPTTHKLIRVQPGGAVPEGAVTASGLSGENAGAVKTEAAAKKAKEDAQHEYVLAQALAANPSPTNDLALVMRYIGATKPDSLGKLRLNNNEVNLVYGTRSALGNLEALMSKLQNGQSLTPQQRTDMIKTMKLLSEGGSGAAVGGAVDPKVKAYADQYFGGDVTKAQAAIESQRSGKK